MYKKEEVQFKILLVEDNPGDVRLVEIFLGESDLHNSKIVNENTLEGAIKALNESSYDVILLDFNLLDSNGFETLDNLLAVHPKANVIVFTGLEDQTLGIRALQAGAQDYLVKGNFGSDFLAKTLRYAIERNRSHLRLEEAERQANKSKERYGRIFTQSKDAIYITKGNGKFVEFNQATLNLFGYTEEELQSIGAQFLYANSAEREGIIKKINKEGFVQDFPIDIRRKDNSIRHCVVTANLVDENNGEKEYHGIIRDITQLKEAEELRKQNDLAEQRDHLRGQLLTMVSHEMRTPMNAIMGLVDLLLGEDLKEEQLSYLASVKNSSEHLLKMINDILQLQKIQFDIELEEATFDLHDMLMNLINIQYSTAKNVAIDIKINPNIPRFVYGDQKRLNQVLINLVSNSLKFTEEGSVTILVNLIDNKEGELNLKFEVQDTGIGIPEDKLDTIFDPFVRVRDTQKKFYPGIGLGLSIVKTIISLMKGDISVTSELDKGSNFSFNVFLKESDEKQLPKAKVKDTPEPQEIIKHVTPTAEVVNEHNGVNGQKNGHANGYDTNNGHTSKTIEAPIVNKIPILLAEDNLMNQLVTKKQLEGKGPFELTIAENGKIATEKLQEKEFRLVLMDIQMPVMDGYEATEYIRNELNMSPQRLPILAMTAHADVVDNEKYKDSGMQDCIVKPVNNWMEVIAKINDHLSEHFSA